MDVRCRVQLLGGLRVEQAGRVITRFRTQKAGLLLAYLAFYRQRAHSRDVLMAMLWPEDEPAQARHKLRLALSSLRRQLEPPGVPAGAVIDADRATVQLNPAACTTDVAEFEAGLQAVARAGSQRERAQLLARLVERYQGELLPVYYEEWVLRERDRLAETYLQALHGLITLLEQAGDLPGAIDWARKAVSGDPLREEAHYELIRLLAAAGQPTIALRHYAELERLLEQELGTAPARATQRLARDLAPVADASHPSPVGVERGDTTAARSPATGTPPVPSRAPGSLSPPEVPAPLPVGTVTLLLGEMIPAAEGSESAEDALPAAVEAYRELLQPLFRGHGGHDLASAGAMLVTAFGRASDALAAAVAGQRALAAGNGSRLWEVRNAVDTGEVAPGEEIQGSPALQHATRLVLAAHPGQILVSEKSAALLREELEPGVHLADLGLFRLHSEAPTERLFQVEDSRLARRGFPPPGALPALSSNLPLQLTRFVGRAEELARLRQLLLLGERRLVTLTGPGGSGKTRLALEAVRRLEEPSGAHDVARGAVWFVSLADCTDPRLIVAAARDALDLPPAPGREPLDQVAEALAGQRALLILDNAEHLVTEAAALVGRLLERVPTLAVLVTSREPLGLPGEEIVPVLPLAVPAGPDTPEQLLRWDSVRLFVERAQAAQPDFQVTKANVAAVAALCARLEGLPLALELAAARAGVLTPAQMLARLGRRFDLLTSRPGEVAPRRRSLWATMDWSYQLLSPELKQFFARLSVFCGGWTLGAAEQVVGGPSPALEQLARLWECSLVLAEEMALGARRSALGESGSSLTPAERRAPSAESGSAATVRYRMLETLREYGAEQLATEERIDLARRHAEYYGALAEEAESALQGPEQSVWMDRLEAEHANMWAALQWLEARGQAEDGLRLAGALWRFWYARGHWNTGRAWLAGLLALPGAAARTPWRARALHGAGVLAHFQGDHREAQALLQESLAIRRALNDRPGIAGSLASLGFLARDRGDYEAAQSLFAESLAVAREAEDARAAAVALAGLGDVAHHRGATGMARSLYQESLAIRRRVGDPRLIAACLNNLGEVALVQHDLAAARARFTEALGLMRQGDNRGGMAWSLLGLGNTTLALGDLEAARALLVESLEIRRALGDRQGIAGCLEGLAAVAGSCGQPERAARLFGAAEALREGIPAPIPPAAGREYDRHVALSRTTVAVERFLDAWAEGRRMTLEHAIAEAMTEPPHD